MENKKKIFIGVSLLIVLIVITSILLINKQAKENTSNTIQTSIEEIQETKEIISEINESEEIGINQPTDEWEVSESDTWEGGVREVTDETTQSIQDQEWVNEEERPEDEFEYQSKEDRESEEYEQFLEMDINEDGILSKTEIYAKGWSYPIDNTYWLYQYMEDPNDDGIIWEEENAD